jgi:hypothetical protein
MSQETNTGETQNTQHDDNPVSVLFSFFFPHAISNLIFQKRRMHTQSEERGTVATVQCAQVCFLFSTFCPAELPDYYFGLFLN